MSLILNASKTGIIQILMWHLPLNLAKTNKYWIPKIFIDGVFRRCRFGYKFWRSLYDVFRNAREGVQPPIPASPYTTPQKPRFPIGIVKLRR